MASFNELSYPNSHENYYVYILRCSNNRTYVGCTKDLDDRLDRHNRGSVPATKDIRPAKLITFIAFSDKDKAFEFEKYLKSGSGRAFLKKRFI
jgi:putative endonuclease